MKDNGRTFNQEDGNSMDINSALQIYDSFLQTTGKTSDEIDTILLPLAELAELDQERAIRACIEGISEIKSQLTAPYQSSSSHDANKEKEEAVTKDESVFDYHEAKHNFTQRMKQTRTSGYRHTHFRKRG